VTRLLQWMVCRGWVRLSSRDSIDRYYLLRLGGWGLFLHRIKRSDPGQIMHTHPWSWASVILGQYRETRPQQATRRRFLWNWCPFGAPHRVEVDRPVWTLLLHGPRRGPWSVTNDSGVVLETEPWSGTQQPERTSYLTPLCSGCGDSESRHFQCEDGSWTCDGPACRERAARTHQGHCSRSWRGKP
jgi:hypothetical protein